MKIDGESYWDGGYSANPPLRELVAESEANDLVLVQLTPEAHDDVPRFAPDITRRLSRMAFNSALQRELDALDDLRKVCREQGALASSLCRKLQGLRIHRIAAEDAVDGLRAESALNVNWSFLLQLKEQGEDAAQGWLEIDRDSVADVTDDAVGETTSTSLVAKLRSTFFPSSTRSDA